MATTPADSETGDSPAVDFSVPGGGAVKGVDLSPEDRARAAAILATPVKRAKRAPQYVKSAKPMAKHPRKKKLADLPLRKAVIEARIAGLQYWQIAEELGVSQSTARGHVERWIKEQTPSAEQTEELRQIMLRRLEALHQTFWKKANGYFDRGDHWHEPDDRAADLLLRVLEREAKIMGVEMQPNTVNISVTAESIASFLGWDDSEAALPVIDVAPASVREQITAAHDAIEAAKP